MSFIYQNCTVMFELYIPIQLIVGKKNDTLQTFM